MTAPGDRVLPELPEEAAQIVAEMHDCADSLYSDNEIELGEDLHNFANRVETAFRAQATLRAGGVWQPIETCPFYKRVLFYGPEMGSWAETVWQGMRQGGDGGDSRNYPDPPTYSVATPFTQADGRQVWCALEGKPTHWMPLPSPPMLAAVDSPAAKEAPRG